MPAQNIIFHSRIAVHWRYKHIHVPSANALVVLASFPYPRVGDSSYCAYPIWSSQNSTAHHCRHMLCLCLSVSPKKQYEAGQGHGLCGSRPDSGPKITGIAEHGRGSVIAVRPRCRLSRRKRRPFLPAFVRRRRGRVAQARAYALLRRRKQKRCRYR